MSKIIDISAPIAPSTAVWPGDEPFEKTNKCHLDKGDSVTLASFKTSAHIGAHADAPSHYHRDGKSIDAVSLDPYLGLCYVVRVDPEQTSVQVSHCENAVRAGARRILFKTKNTFDATVFDRSFTYFSPEAISYMGQNGVKLIGIDTPSVDPFDSKDLAAHNQLYKHDMRNLEGLVLCDVAEGWYELAALPLKLTGFDGSPVRAVLRPAKIAEPSP